MCPNVWGTGGIHEGEYQRHSVDRDVQFFVGWKTLDKLFTQMKNPTHRMASIFSYKLAARITEALTTNAELFTVDRTNGFIFVKDFLILKRWEATDKIIICERCNTKNNKYEVQCTKCHANLIHTGKRKYVTQRKDVKRLPFFIPLSEPYSEEMANFIEGKKGYLFPSPYTAKPLTRQWAWTNIQPHGETVGLDGLYNHWLRSQRLMQLASEKGFSKDELKAFSGIMKDETLDKYVKKVQSYSAKLGINITPERYLELTQQKKHN